MNAENPKSSVIPRSLDYGFLSNPAVEAMVLSALHKEVFPESMWPKTPRFTLRMREGLASSGEELSILSILKLGLLSTIFIIFNT